MQVDLRIEVPFLAASLRVESDDAIERGAEIHRAVSDDGCRLEFAFPPIITTVRDIPGVVFPGDPQLCDIAPVDLSQRRIAAPAGIAAGSMASRQFRRQQQARLQ